MGGRTAKMAAALGPSIARAKGRHQRKDMMVRTPKRFSGVMFSPLGLSIETREKMLRAANARLDSIAPADSTGTCRRESWANGRGA